MTTYVLNYASGAVSEILGDCDSDAERQALDLIGDGAVAAEQWDSDGTNDDGEPMEQLLIWANEADAENDPGARSVAALTVVREVG